MISWYFEDVGENDQVSCTPDICNFLYPTANCTPKKCIYKFATKIALCKSKLGNRIHIFVSRTSEEEGEWRYMVYSLIDKAFFKILGVLVDAFFWFRLCTCCLACSL